MFRQGDAPDTVDPVIHVYVRMTKNVDIRAKGMDLVLEGSRTHDRCEAFETREERRSWDKV